MKGFMLRIRISVHAPVKSSAVSWLLHYSQSVERLQDQSLNNTVTAVSGVQFKSRQ